MSDAKNQAVEALKSIARNQQMKEYVQQSKELYPLLRKVAKRYVTGESMQEGLTIAQKVLAKDYAISLEFIGENTSSIEACENAKYEIFQLINALRAITQNQTVSFDLSHIGLNIDSNLAYSHLLELAEKAKQSNITLMISMEESSKTNRILEVYKKVAEKYSNVGITIQAHLYRSIDDMKELIHLPGKIRIVKGAYQESATIAMPRSKKLNEQFVEMVDYLVMNNHPISIATHDEKIIRELEKRQYLFQPLVGLEMLYGIQPHLMKKMKSAGYHVRLYMLYGREWYLYLCHRLAENPDNIFVAIADIVNQSVSVVEEY
ncbi:proline dehydrogenase family protein [Bacillus sp. JJ722]|uniref:proline dehydrogenase family protein n=1 Tax=Bacillus sp. JJ722 TaxID=3122973 RepID=UPI002FFE6FC2